MTVGTHDGGLENPLSFAAAMGRVTEFNLEVLLLSTFNHQL